MKQITLIGVLVGGMLATGSLQGQTLVTNNGAFISIKNGATVIVKTGAFDNAAGTLHNEGTLIVERDFINGDTANGGGARGLYRIQEDWINNAAFVPDQSTVELYGANQTISGSSVTDFYDLKLQGTGIKTQTINANVLDSLVLNDRELATDAFIMHVKNTDPGAIKKTPGNIGFVSSLGAGRLSWDLDRNFTYRFPTGSTVGTARYRPVEVRPSLNSPVTIDVRMANVDATTEGFDRTNKDIPVCEVNPQFYHLVGRSAGGNPVQLSFLYDPIADGNWYALAHWQGSPVKWEDVGNVLPGSVTGFATLAIPNWTNFTTQPFALARPQVDIDSQLTLLTDATCFNGNNGSIDITVNDGTPTFTFQWSPGQFATEDISGLAAGTYTVAITDTFNCSRSFSFTVDEPAEIGIAAAVDSVNCYGNDDGSIDVSVNNAVLPITSYDWSNAASSQDLVNIEAGTYSLTVTDANGCKKVSVIEVPSPEEIELTPTITNLRCDESGDGSIALAVSGGTLGIPGYSYQWSDSLPGSASQTGLAEGWYTVTVIDGNFCERIDSFYVSQPDTLTLTASLDQVVAYGYSANIGVLTEDGGTPPYTYLWTPSNTVNDSTQSNVVATPEQTTEYVVTISDDNGCAAKDTVKVRVDNTLVAFPDGFTPNGETNNVWGPVTSPAVTVTELKIFNRWGELVSQNPSGWNGEYKGKLQPMDTYVYQAVISLPDGKKLPYSGSFILIQ